MDEPEQPHIVVYRCDLCAKYSVRVWPVDVGAARSRTIYICGDCLAEAQDRGDPGELDLRG